MSDILSISPKTLDEFRKFIDCLIEKFGKNKQVDLTCQETSYCSTCGPSDTEAKMEVYDLETRLEIRIIEV